MTATIAPEFELKNLDDVAAIADGELLAFNAVTGLFEGLLIDLSGYVAQAVFAAHTHSSISNGGGSVSVDSDGITNALIALDRINHKTIFSVGVDTSNENDFGLDFKAYRDGAEGQNRIMEIVPRNCTSVDLYASPLNVYGLMKFVDGMTGVYHADLQFNLYYQSYGSKGFRFYDMQTSSVIGYLKKSGFGINEAAPLSQLHVVNSNAAQPVQILKAASLQAAPFLQGLDVNDVEKFSVTTAGHGVFNRVQIGGTLGPRLRNESGAVGVTNSDETAYVNFVCASITTVGPSQTDFGTSLRIQNVFAIRSGGGGLEVVNLSEDNWAPVTALNFKVQGVQVVGAQQAAIANTGHAPSDAILSVLRTHGLIAM